MKEEYYVQRLARQSYNQMVPIPKDLIIPQSYLMGIENIEFLTAFRAYQEILKQIYLDISINSKGFGMVRLPLDGSDKEKCKNETNSRKSFFRLHNVLLALANIGVLDEKGGLQIDIIDFKAFKNKISSVKITNPEPILTSLTDYGFELEGLSHKLNQKACEAFTISYPENRNIMIVLKAFRNVGYYERMVSADYRHLLDDKGYHDQFNIEDVLRILRSEVDQKLLYLLHQKCLEAGLQYDITYTGFYANIKYFYKKGKMQFVAVHIERDDWFNINIRPENVSKYSEKLKNLSKNIRNRCLYGKDCNHCGYCNHPYIFQYENITFEKCQILCANYNLYNFTTEDIDSVLTLLGYEMDYL